MSTRQNQRDLWRHATDTSTCCYPSVGGLPTNEVLSFSFQLSRLVKRSALKSHSFRSETVRGDEDKVKDFSSPMNMVTETDSDQSVSGEDFNLRYNRSQQLRSQERDTVGLRHRDWEPAVSMGRIESAPLLVWVGKKDEMAAVSAHPSLAGTETGGRDLQIEVVRHGRMYSKRPCATGMMVMSEALELGKEGGLLSKVKRLRESHGKISMLVVISCLHSLVRWHGSAGGVVMAFVPTQVSEDLSHRSASRKRSLGKFVPVSRSKAGRLLDVYIGDATSTRSDWSFFWPSALSAMQGDEHLEGISPPASSIESASEVWKEFEANLIEGVKPSFFGNGESHSDTNGEFEPYSNGKTQPFANGANPPIANGKHQKANGKHQRANGKSEPKEGKTDLLRVDVGQVNGAMKNNHEIIRNDVDRRNYQPIRTDVHGGADVDEPVQPTKSRSTASTESPELHQWTTIMADEDECGEDWTTAHGRKKKPPVSAADYLATAGDALLKELEELYPKLADMSDYDNDQVDRYWARILPTVKYLEDERQIGMVRCGLRVAYRAHRGQMRKSGEPFIVHPVEVLLLLSGLKMDAETLTAAILHDTVEDTDLTFGQIEHMFGHTIRNIVEGETKVSKLPKLAYTDFADEQAENLRQMFVAMTDDYRIIFVKLADRLHNMRTLRYMKKEKQMKISRETLDIFAPLAHRMGVWQFKSELEDTAFMYLHPAEYKRLHQKLRRNQTQFRRIMDKSRDMLIQRLEADDTLRIQAKSVKVFARTKELYSLWHKMTTNSESELNQISDVVGLRVIVEPRTDEDDGTEMGDTKLKVDAKVPVEGGDNINQSQRDQATNMPTDRGISLCYHVLGLVRNIDGFQPIPTKFKDYISLPKVNGYQSLHTAVMLDGQTVEVQIRTAAMHHVAEFGMASYWASTQNSAGAASGVNKFSNELYNTPWLSSIKEWKDDVINARDFVECVRKELLGKRVFVFLRNGKILNLPRGSSVVDAAFQIHTEVALGMHGALINGKAVPFSYELKNGDVVSILTGKGQPAIEWMRYAKSRSTRSKLRSYFRKRQKESLRKAGEILLLDFLETHKELIEQRSFLEGDVVFPTTTEEMAKFLPGRSKFSSVDDLLTAIGSSHDRSVLRGAISKIFRVPLAAVVEAEVKKSGGVRRIAITTSLLDTEQQQKVGGEAESSKERSSEEVGAEVANGDNLCVECLPVRGDAIIGTKSLIPNGSSNPAVSSKTVVHRTGCGHAKDSLDDSSSSKAQNKSGSSGTYKASVWEVSGVGRSKAKARSRKRKEAASKPTEFITVQLEWGEEGENSDDSYLAEVAITAADRKMLLADCSSVVSRLSDIMKTGSSSSDEGATLEFLVRVKNTEELENLMEDLRKIESVTKVERRFGSTLL